jgi:hypothetical protein
VIRLTYAVPGNMRAMGEDVPVLEEEDDRR